MAQRIGLIGLGRMGTPMAANLVRSGFPVHAVDVSPEARARADAAGVRASNDVSELAGRIDLLVLMLPDSDIVEAAIRDAEDAGVLDAHVLIVDMSSSRPHRTRDLAERLAGRGIHMIDAPVSGGVSGAEAANLTIMVGGSDDDVERAEGVFVALGRAVRVGDVGAGHAMKALNNLMSATHLWISGEVMAAGEAFGLDPRVMLDVFNTSSGRSGSTEKKWPDFVVTESYDSGFGLGLMLKDMRIAVELAAHTGSFSGLGDDAVAFWAQAADELSANADHTEIARWIRSRTTDGENTL